MLPLIMFIFGVALLDEDGEWTPASLAGIALIIGAIACVIREYL